MVEILVQNSGGESRKGEPVRCGIPWPRGVLTDPSRVTLLDPAGEKVPHQCRVLANWPDNSIKWLLLDWRADVEKQAKYRIELGATGQNNQASPFQTKTTGEGFDLIASLSRFQFARNGSFPLQSLHIDSESGSRNYSFRLIASGKEGKPLQSAIRTLKVGESGPLRTRVDATGTLSVEPGKVYLEFDASFDLYAGLPIVRVSFTVRNPHRAAHPGGLWDLGDAGSAFIEELSVAVETDAPAGNIAVCSTLTDEPRQATTQAEIYQDSSGGAYWKSTNHYNRNHEVPNSLGGFRRQLDTEQDSGSRANPLVLLRQGETPVLGAAMEYFWQNFPKRFAATASELTVSLFPKEYADVHEIQGGEQKTHIWHFSFGEDNIARLPLTWARNPSVAHAVPEWTCSTAVLPYLVPESEDQNAAYLSLVHNAIEGEDTFERKREIIDEYGWRHFGDIYGDHEAAFHEDSKPLVSHYNNQYDPIAGFYFQFARSGDVRWWKAMEQLAWHYIDIDLYHTDEDKSAYNHGPFWHTYHYVDADTANHRSYPKSGGVCGGGPSAEQAYNAGLAYYYFTTGEEAAKRAAIEMADWVLNIDDGTKTVYRWLDRGHTGLASSSGNPNYHGPGRGSGNAVGVLLEGFRLTGDRKYLEKAEQIIQRVTHPRQNIDALDLLDAERRWYYNMYLQNLGKYLDLKAELNELDQNYAYGREVLLHFARWMVVHEYPYLEKPEILEYPTETWVGQDMRKSDVLKYSAKHASEEERKHFLEKSKYFFDYCVSKLDTMPTKSFCRPVVLLLSNGLMHSYFQKHPETVAPAPMETPKDFPPHRQFVPQKNRAIRRAKLLVLSTPVLLITVVIACWIWLTK